MSDSQSQMKHLASMTKGELSRYNQLLRLLDLLGRKDAAAAKDAKKLKESLDKKLESAQKESKDLIVRRYFKILDALEEKYDPTTYAKRVETLEKKRRDLNDDIAELLDPEKESSTYNRHLTEFASVGEKAPAKMQSLLAAGLTDPSSYQTSLGTTGGGLPRLILRGAGLTDDEVGRLLKEAYRDEDFDGAYELLSTSAEDYRASVEDETADVVEKLWSEIAPRLRAANYSQDEMNKVNELLRAGARDLYTRNTKLYGLQEEHDDIVADLAGLESLSDRPTAEQDRAAREQALEKAMGEMQVLIDAGIRAPVNGPASAPASPEAEGDSQGLPDGGETPSLLDLLRTPEGQMLMGSGGRDGYNPIIGAVMDFAKRAESANEDPAFIQWRLSRGIPENHPVSIQEYNRYQRQARRVGRPHWKARKTGDLRKVSYKDFSYGLKGAAGYHFFLDGDENYVKPEEVKKEQDRLLKDAPVVEIAMDDAANLTHVGNVLAGAGNKEAAGVLRGLANGKAGTRARAFYDKKTGKLVVVDKDRKVLFAGPAAANGEEVGALAALAADPDRVDIAGTAAGVASGQSGNMLRNLDGAVMEEKFDVGVFVPEKYTVTTRPAVTTVVGEFTQVPGADPRNIYLMQEVDGEKKLYPIPIFNETGGLIKGNERLESLDEYMDAVREVGGAQYEPGTDAYKQMERNFNRARRKAARSKRMRERAPKRAPLGAVSTATGEFTEAGDWTTPPPVVEAPVAEEPETDAPGSGRIERGGESSTTPISGDVDDSTSLATPLAEHTFDLSDRTGGAVSRAMKAASGAKKLDGYISEETAGLLPSSRYLRPTDKHDTRWSNAFNKAVAASERGETLTADNSPRRPLPSLGPTPSTGHLQPPVGPGFWGDTGRAIVESNPFGQFAEALRSTFGERDAPPEDKEDEDE